MSRPNKILVALYVAVFIFWWTQTGSPIPHIFYPSLPGQSLYILSKLFGYLGVSALLMQVTFGVVSLLKTTQIISKLHSSNAKWLIVFSTLHIALFVTAVSVRNGGIHLDVLVPKFTDYYNSKIAIGIVSYCIVLSAMLMGIANKNVARSFLFRVLHFSSAVLVVLMLSHALSIGSETKESWFLAIFMIPCMIFLVPLYASMKSRQHLTEKNAIG